MSRSQVLSGGWIRWTCPGSDGVSITPSLPDRDGDGIPELASGLVGIGSSTTFLLEDGPASSTLAYGPLARAPSQDQTSFDASDPCIRSAA